MFTKYFSKEELMIFEYVKKYFEKFPPIGSDAYKNSFYDLVAQYGPEGEDYMIEGPVFSELIELQLEKAYLQLSQSDKEEIKELYEKNFIKKDYYDAEVELYFYDSTDLSIYISTRFKRWILDSFDSDYLR